MAQIEHSWLTPSRIASIQIRGDISVDEVDEMHHILVHHYIQSGEAPVHIIVDIHQVGSFPTNVIKMQETNRLVLGQPALGWVMVIGVTNVLQRFLVSTVAQMFKSRIRTAQTLHDALHQLKRIDTTL